MELHSCIIGRLSIKVGLRTRKSPELQAALMLSEGQAAGAGTQRCSQVSL